MIDWLDEFYGSPETKQLLEESYAPLFAEYGAAIAAVAGAEVGVTPAVSPFIAAIASTYVDNYLSSSRAQMQEMLSAPDPRAAIEQRLAEWVEKRPGKVAQEVTVQTSNAVTQTVYKDAGITRKKWNARGKSCPYCRRMNGKVVGIDRPFHREGDSIEVPDSAFKAKLNFTHEIGHPPQHAGCDCVIEADMQLGLPGLGGPDIPLVGSRHFQSDGEALAWADRSLPATGKLRGKAKDNVAEYTGGGYASVNRKLRGTSRSYYEDFGDMTVEDINTEVAADLKRAGRITPALDKVMAPIPENVTVFRAMKGTHLGDFGIEGDDLTLLRGTVGQTFEDAGFVSTSLGTDVLEKYQDREIWMHLTVQKGTRAAYMKPISYFTDENELLLDHGLSYTVTGIRQEADHWVMEAVVLP